MTAGFQPKASKWPVVAAALVGVLIWAIATEYVPEMRAKIVAVVVIFLIGALGINLYLRFQRQK